MNSSKYLGLALVALLAACHDNDRRQPQDPPPPPADTTPPTAVITFPPRDSFTADSTVRVTGKATDAGGVTQVRVNGVLATSTDSFANWTVDVALTGGSNLITVETRDAAGNASANAAQRRVWQREEITNVSGGEMNAAGTALYFVDAGARAIRALALDTGNVTQVASLAQFSNGPVPLDLALDLANNHIYLGVRNTDPESGSTTGIWRYDTVAATWAVISDATHPGPAAPVLGNPTDLIFDGANNRLLVMDWTEGLVMVNLANGMRTLISDNSWPNGNYPTFGEPMDMALDANANRVIVIDRGRQALFAVSLETGVRTLISDETLGTGIDFTIPLSMALDLARNRALVWDTAGQAGVIAVDLATGNRSVFVDNSDLENSPDAEEFGQSDVRVLALANGLVYSIDTSSDVAQGFDLLSGARTRISNNGFRPNQPRLCAEDAEIRDGNITMLTRQANVVRIAADGTRTTIAESSSLPGATVIEVDATANLAYAASTNSIWRVNMSTGSVVLLADETVPANQPALGLVRDIVLDTVANRLYAVAEEGVMSINTTDGTRTRVSVNNPLFEFSTIRGATLDRTGNRLLVADDDFLHLIAVDLATGAHAAFSDSSAAGDALESPWGVAMDAAGVVWAVDDRQRVVRIDRSTGARALLSSSTVPDSLNFFPQWQRPLVDGDALYVRTRAGDLFSLNKTTGARVGVARCGATGAL